MRDVKLDDYVAVYGRPHTAKAMGVTLQRIQQMVTRGEAVYVRLDKANEVVGYYLFREVK